MAQNTRPARTGIALIVNRALELWPKARRLVNRQLGLWELLPEEQETRKCWRALEAAIHEVERHQLHNEERLTHLGKLRQLRED